MLQFNVCLASLAPASIFVQGDAVTWHLEEQPKCLCPGAESYLVGQRSHQTDKRAHYQ